MSSYIPAEDSKLLDFLQNASTRISASPGTYFLSEADADNLAYVVTQFALTYAVAIDPVTRSPVNTNAKDAARATAVQLFRTFAQQIKYNIGITDADKLAIGVRPVNHHREPIHDPDSSPLLNIVGGTPGAQTLRYADSNTPDTGRKPYGCTSLQLFVHVGEAPIDDPDLAGYYGAFTRNPIGVTFDAADDRKVATYFARWSTARGAVGPWSLPVSMTIAA